MTTIIAEGKFKDGLKFFTPDCTTHNPYIAGDMNALTDGMIAASSPSPTWAKGGLRQAHILRFEGDKIAEYWDISQQITENMPNAKGAF